MKTNRIFSTWIAGFAVGFFALAVQCGAQNSSVPELAVLQKYVGKWETTLTATSGSGGQGKETEMTASIAADWILDGRYVQQTSTVQDDAGAEAIVVTTLMTYDTGAGVYRAWSFTSVGTTSQGEGSWDEDSNTMTWTGSDVKANTTTTTTGTFVKDGEEHWSIATENSSGELVSLITGKNQRRAK